MSGLMKAGDGCLLHKWSRIPKQLYPVANDSYCENDLWQDRGAAWYIFLSCQSSIRMLRFSACGFFTPLSFFFLLYQHKKLIHFIANFAKRIPCPIMCCTLVILCPLLLYFKHLTNRRHIVTGPEEVLRSPLWFIDFLSWSLQYRALRIDTRLCGWTSL